MINKKNFRKALLLIPLFLIAINAAEGKKPIFVFLLGGQSNMSGDAAISGLSKDLSGKFDSVSIYLDPTTDGAAARKGKWMTLEPGFGWCNAGKTSFGPELLLGITLTQKYPDAKIALIKSSVAGTDLAKQWLSPSSGTAGKLYNGLVKCIKDALATLDTTKYTPVISGMCWMQGEADAMNQTYANNYKKNLTNFIADIRKEVKSDKMPFIAAQIDEQVAWTNYKIVNDAMKAIADADPNVYTFPTKGFNTDGIHYQTQGMIDLGKAYAKIVIDKKMMEPIVPVTFGRHSTPGAVNRISPLNNSVVLYNLTGRKICAQSVSTFSSFSHATPGCFIVQSNAQAGQKTSAKVLSTRVAK